MSGALSGSEDMKGSVERPARATLDHHHRHGQDRLGSVERADDGRRGHKTGARGSDLICCATFKFSCSRGYKFETWTSHSVAAALLAQVKEVVPF